MKNRKPRATLLVGVRAKAVRNRSTGYAEDSPDEFGTIEPNFAGEAVWLSRQPGTRGLRCRLLLDNGSVIECFADNVFPV